MRTLPAAIELPPEYAVGIGHVITHWAFLEWLLRKITYELLGVDQKHGRVAVREPRAEDYIKMYNELIQLAGITVPIPEKLAKDLAAGKTMRDLIAHGVWMKDGDKYFIQATKGSDQREPQKPNVSRKISPVGEEFTPQSLDNARKYITTMINRAQELLDAVRAALASSRKSPSLDALGSPPRAQS